MSKRDYYQILGVDENTSKNEIKAAYKKIALKYHPDRNPDNKDAEAKFKEASEAAEILLNDEKRTRYNQFGHAGVDGQAGGFGGSGGFQGADLGDIFGELFGDVFSGGRRGQRVRGNPGNDLQQSLNISFEEAAFGTKKNISIRRLTECGSCNGSGGRDGASPQTCTTCGGAGEVRRQQGFFTVSTTCPQCRGLGERITDPCNSCRGHGRVQKPANLEVTIPAGIDRGQRLKISGEGDCGTLNAPGGDLYILIDIKGHEIFDREGTDVHCTIPISFSQAALGCEIKVPTLSGEALVPIPEGTQAGKKMRLKGKGIAKLGGYGIGDQILTIHVETPTKLTPEQRELFGNLGTLEDRENCNPMSRGFFDKVKELFH